MNAPIPNREQGYVLVEAVVALAVIAVVSAMFLAAVQSGALASRHVEQVRAASLVAQSQLARAVVEADPVRGGIADGFAWSVDVSAYPASDNAPPVERVAVTVRDGAGGRPVAMLETLRLAR